VLGLVPDFFAAECRYQHDGRLLAKRLVTPDKARGFKAIHARHAPVHVDHVVGLMFVHAPDFGHCSQPGADRVDTLNHAAQGLLNDLAGRNVVVGHQHPQAGQALGHHRACCLGFPHAEPGGEGDRRAHVRLALQPDLPVHHLDQAAADRQAQAGAAVLAGGGHVALREGLEQAVGLLPRHADAGVLHRKAELAPLARRLQRLHAQPDLPALGELDRIADQVGEDLPEAKRITHQALAAPRPAGAPGTPAPFHAPSAR
jgi:hypothetical protein